MNTITLGDFPKKAVCRRCNNVFKPAEYSSSCPKCLSYEVSLYDVIYSYYGTSTESFYTRVGEVKYTGTQH
jgi:hypothetical protein